VEETGFTLDGRVLCGDDACVGTIGADRRCKICGKPYEGGEPVSEGASAAGPAPETKPDSAAAPPAADADGTAADPDERRCCPDDACTGIVGADGKCGTCGKPGI